MTGSEALIAQAISGIAVPVFQTLWGQGGKVLGLFGKTLDEKAKRAIFKASRQYAQNYTERHGILKVLGMREPVSLESVYTTVQFLNDAAIRSFESVETLETVYREAKQRSFQSKDCPKQPGITVANQKQYLMVLGSPGSGKSTFLRRMGLEALKGKKGKFKHACIPVLIELKTFNQGDIDIEHKIAEEFRICGFPSYPAFTAKALEQGKLLILLDGLDEVPTERMNQVIQHIQNFVDLHDKNRFIASCRVAAYRNNFRRFTDVAMAEFDDDQIEKFISNWFGREPQTGQECWQKLNHQDNKAAKELTQTPLLLTLVCLLYQRSRKFPTNRATLYERALRVLLEEWAAEKGVFKDDVYKGLDTKRKEMILSEIAHDAFQADHLFLPRREITDQIEELLAEMLPDETFIDGEAVLRSIEKQHGVLVQRAEGVYSFSHLTLQEYLTAQYIDDHRQIEKLVKEHLTDQRWREVFLLVSGLMRGGADELLLLMEKEAQTYINTPRLQALLRWADWITADSESNMKPVAKRAIAYVIANTLANAITLDYANYLHLNIYARAIARTLGFSRNLANADDFVSTLNLSYVRDRAVSLKIAKNLTRDLEKIKIFKNIDFTLMIARIESLKTKLPDSNQPYKVHKEFANKLLQIWLKAFNLKKHIIQLSVKETSAFHNYFYVNYLIIQCKKSAVRVSPKTWAAIEERMLRVPDNG
ncbi:MAG: NACHT domain-containing protein [Coleofasciculus sp. B1-GNL1-01]|uniref:NACHT domain-containing protein n=1 Tax=Coleofasciculus sp. B1-GNL1-01 TaxID=3068484 RepID=UPI0033022CA1